jgi:hypothetical protein
MTNLIRRYWKPLAIFIVPLAMFWPSLFGFFTNDDFFFLRIAHVSSFKDFFNFFNLLNDVGGIGVYRPLTLRVFYFLGVELFRLNPMPLHVISFITFFINIFMVGRLVELLTKNHKIALLSSFLYATSVTHFGQLYYIGAFQELFLTLLFLSSVIFFIKNKVKTSMFLFVLALMSKETAVVIPFVLIATHFYLRLTSVAKVSLRKLTAMLTPYFVILGIYLFLHFHNFGTISGDSYVWDFSPSRAVNSIGWYGLWSLNLPEMLVDFVGPGLHLNPNLLKYWAQEIIPIFILFFIQVAIMIGLFFKFVKSAKGVNKNSWYLIIFSLFWFAATLLPVLFLPVHKFTYYLTLPLFGVVLILGYLLNEARLNRIVIGLFLAVWTIMSFLTLRLTINTNWIIQGAKTSERVYQYFKANRASLAGSKIIFVDTLEDKSLPWSPTATLKTVLSGNNFFYVFYPEFSEKVKFADSGEFTLGKGMIIIKSRQFLGY